MNSLSNQSGFSLIEVLVAISLMSILLVSAEKIRLYSLQFSHQTLFQSIALERLGSLSSLLKFSQKNILTYYDEWNQDNKKLLPDGRGDIYQSAHYFVIQIFWRSFLPSFWHCNSKPLKGLACEELKILT